MCGASKRRQKIGRVDRTGRGTSLEHFRQNLQAVTLQILDDLHRLHKRSFSEMWKSFSRHCDMPEIGTQPAR